MCSFYSRSMHRAAVANCKFWTVKVAPTFRPEILTLWGLSDDVACSNSENLGVKIECTKSSPWGLMEMCEVKISFSLI